MIAGSPRVKWSPATSREGPRDCHHVGALLGQGVGRVDHERVAARLGFEQQREGGIARDGDAVDRVHLDRDGQSHGGALGDRARAGLQRRTAHGGAGGVNREARLKDGAILLPLKRDAAPLMYWS